VPCMGAHTQPTHACRSISPLCDTRCIAWGSQVNFPESRHAMITTTLGNFAGGSLDYRRKWWVLAAALTAVLGGCDRGPGGATSPYSSSSERQLTCSQSQTTRHMHSADRVPMCGSDQSHWCNEWGGELQALSVCCMCICLLYALSVYEFHPSPVVQSSESTSHTNAPAAGPTNAWVLAAATPTHATM
jgi:hypothetical protein